jgi:hypothetical protein
MNRYFVIGVLSYPAPLRLALNLSETGGHGIMN